MNPNTASSFSLSPRLFWSVIAVYFAARLLLSVLSYIGDTSSESRARVLNHFSEESIDQGTQYHRAGFAVAVVYFLVSELGVILFIVSGLSSWLASLCLTWSGGRAWLQVIFFVTIISVVAGAASLPFMVYLDYVIEHRFGFSNLTLGGWIGYQLKNAVVGGALALLIVSLAYVVLRRFSVSWVWMIPVGALALQLGMTLIYPRLIMPIFYKIERIDDPALMAAITEVTDKAGVEVKSLNLIDASRYSTHTNAFFIGFGKFKSIYLYDTLLKTHEPEEVAAIFAHELGHWMHNHTLKAIVLSEAGIILTCVLLYFFFPVLERTEFLKIGALSDVSALPMLILLSYFAAFVASPVANSISRRFERQADQSCLALTKSADVFVRDFKKLAEANHSNLLPHPAVVFWRFTHPPIVDRIEMIDQPQPG